MHLRALQLVTSMAIAPLLTLSCASSAPASVSTAGSDSQPLPDRIFSPASFWYRQLPSDAPLDPRSDNVVKRIIASAPNPGYRELARGQIGMAINTKSYTPPIYVARNSDPTVTFQWTNCQGKPHDQGFIRNNLKSVHMPAGARPSEGSDGELVIYNADTGSYTDTWQTSFDGTTWRACWGGTIANAGQNPGVFPAPYGVTASGLPLEPGTIKASELAAGHINHVVGIVLPSGAVGTRASRPATRTDGTSTDPNAIAQGQLLRLPADLNIDSLRLSRTARIMAKAAQEYGFIVWDQGEGVSFRAENAQAMRSDPYPAIFQGEHPALTMWGNPAKGEQPFPFERLQVVRRGYASRGMPAVAAADQTP